MGAPRRVATGLLAGALMIVGIAHAPAAGATDDVTSERLAGATRYGTAAAVSADAAFEGATSAILATGENFPDALAASGLAGSTAATPILLTRSDNLSDEAVAALDDLAVDEVTVVGGTAAVSDDVVSELEENGYTVTRVAGTDRYGTAAAIANAMDSVGEVDGLVSALIATGENYPDALAGGPVAYDANLPILLINSDGIPSETAAAIDDLGIEQAIILGGTAAVSDDTAAELADATGNDVVRLAGVNRFGTAAAVGDFEIDTLGFDGPDYILTTGVNFPDALAAGPLGGQLRAPIVLTASLPDESADFLDRHSDILSHQIVVGGTAAVDEDTAAAAEAAAETTGNDTPTGGDTVTSALEGPELQSAAISGFDLEDLVVVYTFSFDEDVDDTVQPDLFKLYGADSRDASEGDIFNGGDDVDVDGSDVAVSFNLADYGVAAATLAAVEEGAVEDEDGNQNPAQSVATGGLVNASGSGLLSVTVTDEDDGIVEYTFSTPQIPGLTKAAQFEVIDRDGTTYTSNDITGAGQDTFSVTSPDEDEPSTTVEVDFSADFSDATLRRGVVKSNTSLVPNTSANSRINAADISGGGTTDAPDLVEVQFASEYDDLDDDEALFIFDEAIDSAGAAPDNANLFDLVYSNCDPAAAGSINATIAALAAFAGDDGEALDGEGFDDTITLGDTCAIPGTSAALDGDNNRAVLVTFGADDLDNDFLVAAQVAEGAGIQEENGTSLLTNDDDEVEFAAASEVFADGEVYGPQLIGATVEIDTNVFGDFQNFVVTLTWDKALDDGLAIGGLGFWYNDGSNVEREDLDAADCDYDGDTEIVCEIDDEDSALADVVVISADAGATQTDSTFVLDSDELAEAFTSPEGSVPVDSPGSPS